MCICGNYSTAKNKNNTLVPKANQFTRWQKMQTHLLTPCLHLHLPLLQHYQQIAVGLLLGLSVGMGFQWELHGKCPMGWDGTARIAFPMSDNECQNDNEL